MFDSIDQGPKKSKNKQSICLFNIGKIQLCENISEELFVAVYSELELFKIVTSHDFFFSDLCYLLSYTAQLLLYSLRPA